MHINRLLNAFTPPFTSSSPKITGPGSPGGSDSPFESLLRANTDPSPSRSPFKPQTSGGNIWHHGNGIRVAVSGHSYNNAADIDIFDEETAKALGLTHLHPESGKEVITTHGTYGVTLTISGPLVGHFFDENGGIAGLPIGVKPLMPIAYYGVGDDENGLTQPLFNSEAEKRAYWQDKIEDFAKILETERQLKEQYGGDARLAYDHMAKEYIMLMPEDYGYDNTQSGEQALTDLKRDVRFTGLNRDEVNEILGRRGLTV